MLLTHKVVPRKKPHRIKRGDLMRGREPDLVMHNGLTRIYGPQLSEEEFEFLDEELAIGIIEFFEALRKQRENDS
jgi:hypothetical protein